MDGEQSRWRLNDGLPTALLMVDGRMVDGRMVDGRYARDVEEAMTAQRVVSLNGQLTRARHDHGQSSARRMAGVGYMSRVLLPVAMAVVIAGCSMNAKPLTTAFNDPAAGSTASTSRQGALGGEPGSRPAGKSQGSASAAPASGATAGTKVASADRALPGTSEKAPKGALSDRDYSQTKLDAEVALELVNQYRKQNGLKPLKITQDTPST